MAHFYGVLQGARGEASRLGHKGSGLTTTAASWVGAVVVELYYRGGFDMARVRLAKWKGQGVERVLYDGPVAGIDDEKAPGSPLAGPESHKSDSGSDPWLRGYQAGYKAAQDALGVQIDGETLTRVADALGTGETGDGLVSVARNAHTAEQRLAAGIRAGEDHAFETIAGALGLSVDGPGGREG